MSDNRKTLVSGDHVEVFDGCRTTVTYLALKSREGFESLVELTAEETDWLIDRLRAWRPEPIKR